MSKLTDELRLALPVEQASEICHAAIAAIGWKIKEADQRRIVPAIGMGVTRNPSKIEVLLADADESGTVVTFNGSIMGVGPIQKNHLRREIDRLRHEIEVAAATATATAASTGPDSVRTSGDDLDRSAS